MKKLAYFNWSSGKDSALALYQVQGGSEYNVDLLLTSVNGDNDRVSMHGIKSSLVEKQGESLGINVRFLRLPAVLDMDEYNQYLKNEVNYLVESGYNNAIFGDIFLEDLRKYREQQLSLVGVNAVFPLWKKDTTLLIKEFISLGFKTIVTCVSSEYLDQSFVGRVIDQSFIDDLPSNVDVCGENGEFHTFTYDGPNFKFPVDFELGEVVYKEYSSDGKNYGFWYIDLI